VAADFDGDGRIDVVTANTAPGINDSSVGTIAFFAGNGDGTLQTSLRFATGGAPAAMVSADFNGDGRPDVAIANVLSSDVSVLLGQGDGTFQDQIRVPVGSFPDALAAADFNRDGRTDLAVADRLDNNVTILLGVGDGTFREVRDRLGRPIRPAVGRGPTGITAGDFNGDGILDLAVADAGSGDVVVLMGNGDGTFQPARVVAAGLGPSDVLSIIAGRFHGPNAPLDLAVADSGTMFLGETGTVTILTGNGDGTFRATGTAYPVGTTPVAIVAADFRLNGMTDLAVANKGNPQDNFDDGSVSILLGNGDGTFQPHVDYPVGTAPLALAVGRFRDDNQDNRIDPADFPDLVTANELGGDIRVLLGNGDGTFGDTAPNALSQNLVPDGFEPPLPTAVVTGDFDGNGTTDVVTANASPNNVSVLLGQGEDGRSPFFFDFPGAPAKPASAPLLLDVNGDGIPDSVVVNGAGQILVRLGHGNGLFSPPLVVNPTDRPALAVATVRSGNRTLLAATDPGGDIVSLYAIAANGRSAALTSSLPVSPNPTPVLTTGFAPTRIVTGNLRGVRDGFDDLVVLDSFVPRISVFLSDGAGGFQPVQTTDLGGSGPTDLTLADLNGDGTDDIVVTNQISGDVTVLMNNGNGQNFSPQVFRAGTGPYAFESQLQRERSLDRLGQAVVGDFNGDGTPDLLVPDAGSNSLALLLGAGSGRVGDFDFARFLNPVGIPLDLSPTVVVAGRFKDTNGDGRIDDKDPLDLAILDRTRGIIEILYGDGSGGFTEEANADGQGHPFLDAGNSPTGLSVVDFNGDGIPDLQVGNAFGDVLTFLGNGDGTFRPFERIDRSTSFAIAKNNGPGKDDFILSDHALDRLVGQFTEPGLNFSQDRANGIQAPDAVQIADLNGDGIPDLAVANSGGNDVLVYLGTGPGQFDPTPLTFFVGTDPVGLTIADLTGNGIPDVVVADEGSNDISILLGQGKGTDWTLTPGPRLRAGIGPISTTVADVTGPAGVPDGIPDILVTNNQSNDVTLLPGRGNGFFNDQTPQTFAVGDAPQQSLVGNFEPGTGIDLVTIDSGSNNLTFRPDFLTSSEALSIDSGGDRPFAAIEGDFNGDGISDLIVANNGNGAISVFLGGANGPSMFEKPVFPEDIEHPTSLEFAVPDTGQLYISQEGVDNVAFFRLPFAFTRPGEPPGTGEQSGGMASVQFALLPESTLALIATVVTVSASEAAAVEVEQAASEQGGESHAAAGGGGDAVTGDVVSSGQVDPLDFVSGLENVSPPRRVGPPQPVPAQKDDGLDDPTLPETDRKDPSRSLLEPVFRFSAEGMVTLGDPLHAGSELSSGTTGSSDAARVAYSLATGHEMPASSLAGEPSTIPQAKTNSDHLPPVPVFEKEPRTLVVAWLETLKGDKEVARASGPDNLDAILPAGGDDLEQVDHEAKRVNDLLVAAVFASGFYGSRWLEDLVTPRDPAVQKPQPSNKKSRPILLGRD
jgi:hypothetical protein